MDLLPVVCLLPDSVTDLYRCEDAAELASPALAREGALGSGGPWAGVSGPVEWRGLLR